MQMTFSVINSVDSALFLATACKVLIVLDPLISIYKDQLRLLSFACSNCSEVCYPIVVNYM